MTKILISAGHQPGLDSGAVGQGQQEANDNVRICDRVVLYLRAWGINTIYMPNNVGNLQGEINWANDNLALGAGYAIQIHRNAGGGTGNEVWTTPYANQVPLATAILKAMTEITKLPNRGVKDIKANNNPLGWINYVNAESVLIEARFIDRDSITDADDMLDAYAIACGIADFLKIPRGKSEEQKQIEAAKAAAEAAAAAKAEAERLAKLAEEARIAKELAEAQAKKAAEEQALADKAKAEADKALQDQINAMNQENLNILQIIFKAIKDFITAIMAKKG